MALFLCYVQTIVTVKAQECILNTLSATDSSLEVKCYFIRLFFLISWNDYQESDILHTGHLGLNEVVTNSFKVFDILKGLKKSLNTQLFRKHLHTTKSCNKIFVCIN